ncbi:phage tail protein [Vibrio mediterranei]|uniref:phage tail-collar fiber domain-containing protein n=1 Tax=Vibrio mediterranei TaxID=689 RepID=UPI001F0C4BFF|nr:phage tail protein [Vibrio mediterranei]
MSIPESELSYGSILTLTGENAEINGKLNNKPINFTHIAIGDANDVYVQPSRTQTTLVNEITRIPVTGMEKITPSEPDGVPQLKVWAKIPDNIVDIAVREFAAVATFDGNSYLHAVGNSVRIPILSGSNNGGEVNDIFIEMTFAVTSLEPIVMIDPTIVTATRDYVDDRDKFHLDADDPHNQYLRKTQLNPSNDLNKNFGEGHFYFTNSPAHNPDSLTDGYHFFLDRNITHYGNAKDVLFSIEPVGTKVKKFVRYQISGQWQPWERVATLSNINESLEDKLNHLPIYPETLTSDNKAVLTLSGTTLTVAESNVIALRGWNRIKASDYALEQRQFTIDLSKTYHLRFNMLSGFYLEDLASASYNPTSQPQTNSAFDSTLDNVLIAAIESGVVTAYRNVTELPIKIGRLETAAALRLNVPTQDVECMRLEMLNDYARGFICNVRIDAVFGAVVDGAQGYGYLTAYCDSAKVVKQRMHLGTSAGVIGYIYDKNVPISCQMPFNRGTHVVSLDNHLEFGQYCFNTDPAVNGHNGWQKSISTIDVERV